MTGTIAVVTDSTAQLGPALAARVGIVVVPVTVLLDGGAIDDASFPVDAFYERLDAGADASTAAPGPAVFAEVYERLAAEGASAVVSVHVDGRLSAVVDSARLGASEVTIPVHVVDSGQVTFGVGLCALAARRAAETGRGPEAIAGAVARLSPQLRNASYLPARAGPGRAGSGSAVVEVANGMARALTPADTPSDGARRITTLVREHPGAVEVAIGHAGAVAAPHAHALAESLEAAGDVSVVTRYRVGHSVGVHVGPGAFGCFWWPAGAAAPIRERR